jgi:hypothetical protein
MNMLQTFSFYRTSWFKIANFVRKWKNNENSPIPPLPAALCQHSIMNSSHTEGWKMSLQPTIYKPVSRWLDLDCQVSCLVHCCTITWSWITIDYSHRHKYTDNTWSACTAVYIAGFEVKIIYSALSGWSKWGIGDCYINRNFDLCSPHIIFVLLIEVTISWTCDWNARVSKIYV